MAKENKKEISFVEGPIFQSLIRFALPVLGALILQAAYGAVDLLVVGWFGDASSISAVGTGSNFMQMVTLIITSLAMGSTVMIGQHIGEGKPDKAGKTVGTSIVLFAIIGIAMTVILELFAGPIANILQVPAESFDKTVLYLRICSGGILIIIAYNVISSVLRGIGNANLPLLFVGIACAANIAGDLFFVGVLKLDVAGAALATVLAQLISVIASMGVLKKGNLPIEFKKEDCRIDHDELKKVLNVGVPIALQETTVQISFLVINSIINGMGLMPSAGYGVAQKLTSFIMLIPSSVMQSVSAFVAQNTGAGKKDLICKEKMFPVMAYLTYEYFDQAIKIAETNLRMEGNGHTAGIHSNNQANIIKAGTELSVSRLIVNAPCATTAGGSIQNGLPVTNTLGCGSWGNNSISENFTYKHLLNITRIAPLSARIHVPSDEEIWAD